MIPSAESDVLAQLAAHRVLPVVVLDDVALAAPVASALIRGGLPVAEITLRTPAAIEAIARLSEVDDLLVGAGTVLTPTQVDASVAAGAQFVVSPGTSRSVVERCQERGVLALPGVVTPSDVMNAMSLGVQTVKFFPAASSGGIRSVAALAAVFGDIRFVPTGGIDASNAAQYLRLPSVLAVGGSWMVPRSRLAAGDFAHVEQLAAGAVELAGSLQEAAWPR